MHKLLRNGNKHEIQAIQPFTVDMGILLQNFNKIPIFQFCGKNTENGVVTLKYQYCLCLA